MDDYILKKCTNSHYYVNSLGIDHQLVVDQLKSQWESNQLELKEQREKVTDLIRQLNDKRFDEQ